MILSELKIYLKDLGKRPNKGLSQNFLIDPNITKKIVQLADVQSGDHILEIGPGPGALTKALLDTGANVYAIEKDEAFAESLSRLQNGRFKVYAADFLEFPLSSLPSNTKVVANLPYNITTPILEKAFSTPLFSSLTIMVQKEIADRIRSTGGKSFGSLSVFVQFYTEYLGSFPVPRSCFYPAPNVDSTVIRLDLKDTPKIDPIGFFELVHAAFQKRRKMLSGTLPFPKNLTQEALVAIGSRPDVRPEALSFEKWVALFKKTRELLLQSKE